MGKVRIRNKKRIIVAFLLLLALMVVLSFRTAWIQVVKAEEYSQIAINQQMSDIPLEANRGTIYDRNGQQLAISATCYSVWIRPQMIRDRYTTEARRERLCQNLALILDMNVNRVKERVESDSPMLCLARYQDKNARDQVVELDIPGLEISEGSKRYYPLEQSAAHLLGSVSDDNTGRSGIEMQFDNVLSGTSGRWIKETDLNGDTLSYGSQKYFQAKDGYNVHLTIDEVLQHYAEEAVAGGLKKTKAKRIMCLVMEPKTGDILAMVTNPSFDPNNALQPADSKERKAFNKLSDEKQAKYLSKMWTNPIVSDLYEPGSTFKLVTTSSSLEEGIVNPKTKFNDKGSIKVGDTVLHCWFTQGHGEQTLTEAVGNSCNPVQVQLALKLGKKKYYNYLEMFGITDKTYVDLPAETSAIIQDEENLSDVSLATMSFGHGIAVTPIQLLTAVCSIGNDGVLMKPRIVSKLTDSEGKTVREYKVKQVRKVMSSKTADEMKDIMEYVVAEGGGGLAKVEGYRIGGKTGTADKVENGHYSSNTYASFVGMAPMDDPKIAVLVVVDSPKGGNTGGATAAPIAQKFLSKSMTYLEISPQSEKDKQAGEVVYVPDVKGMKYEKALKALKKVGLTCKVSPEPENGDLDFTIVDQYPAAGTASTKGDAVFLYRE